MHICSTRDVVHITNLSRTTIWRLERAGEFPKRLQLAANRVGWREEEIRNWIDTRPQALPQYPYEPPMSKLAGGHSRKTN